MMINATRWGLIYLGLSMILTAVILYLIPKEQIIVENINLNFEPGALEIADETELVNDYPSPEELEKLLINQ